MIAYLRAEVIVPDDFEPGECSKCPFGVCTSPTDPLLSSLNATYQCRLGFPLIYCPIRKSKPQNNYNTYKKK